MNTPMISIIIPVYKVESFLALCIQSILNQTYNDFELILVDDGSPDKSGDICDDFAKRDPRIKVIHKENEGVSKARNTGIDVSRGKYIMFADSDDFVEPTWCEEMINSIKRNSLVISTYYINDLRENKNIKEGIFLEGERNYFSFYKKNIFPFYQKNLINSPCNKIYSSNIIKRNKIYFNENLSLGEDLLFNLDYLKNTNDEIIVVNKPLYNYVLRGRDSLNVKYHENLFDIYKQLFNQLYNSLIIFSVDLEETKPKYYNSYLHALNHVLADRFFKESKLPFFCKWKYNSAVIKSNEFNQCLKYADFDGLNKVYVSLLKSQNYFLVYFYNSINQLRIRK